MMSWSSLLTIQMRLKVILLSLGEPRAVILNQTVTTKGILNMATWDEVKKI